MDDLRFSGSLHCLFCNDTFTDRIIRWCPVHQIHQSMLHNGTKSSGTCFSLEGFTGNNFKCLILELKFHSIQFKKLVILLGKRVLGLFQDTDQSFFIKGIQCYNNRNSSDKFRDQTEFNKSSGITSLRTSPTLRSSFSETSAPKPMDLVSCLDSMIFSSPSKAPPQMNRMFVVSIWINS